MTVMRRHYESTAARREVPGILRLAGEETLARAFIAVIERPDLSEALDEHLEPVARALESIAVDPSYNVVGAPTINFATALRLYGPPSARHGPPLDWRRRSERWFEAVDDGGTSWDVRPGTFGWGLTVAEWDRPDWYTETLEEAQLLASEIVARPSFSSPPRDVDMEILDDD